MGKFGNSIVYQRLELRIMSCIVHKHLELMFEVRNIRIILIILILPSCSIKQYQSYCIHQYVANYVSSKMKCKDRVNFDLKSTFKCGC